jgi:hypothetical protein
MDGLMDGLGDLVFLVVSFGLGLGLTLVVWTRSLERATLALRVLCRARGGSTALAEDVSLEFVLLGFEGCDDLELVVLLVVLLVVIIISVHILAVFVSRNTFARSLGVGGALHHRIGSLHVGIARHEVGRIKFCGTTASEEGVCGSGGVLQHEQEERRLDDDAQL